MNNLSSICSGRLYQLAILTAVTGGSFATTGLAQDANVDRPLEQVLVTAQKRVQSLQDVPMSVSALNEDVLLNAGVNDVHDMQALVPSLNIFSGAQPASTSINLRGAGTGAADPTLQPSVGLFIDGAFMPRSVFGTQDLVDVSTVEVLLGPQGTLYGKNTNSGVLAINTKGMPESTEFQAETTLGNYNKQEVKLSGATPLSDTVAVRLGLVKRDRDGYLDNVTTGNDVGGEDKVSARGQLYWDLSESVSARLIAYTSEDTSGANHSEHNFDSQSVYRSNLIPSYAALLGVPLASVVDDIDDNRKIAVNENPSDRTLDPLLEVDGGSLQFDIDLGALQLTSISAWQSWSQTDFIGDTDGTGLDIAHAIDNMEETSFSQEVRLSSFNNDTFNWITGLFYFDSELERGSETQTYSSNPLGLPGVASPANLASFAPNLIVAGDHSLWYNKHSSESIAVFGQGTWTLSDNTSLIFGLRYGEEDKALEMSSSSQDANGVQFNALNVLTGQYQGGAFVPLAGGGIAEVAPTLLAIQAGQNPATLDLTVGPVDRSGSRKDTDLTGMLSINHKVDNAMFYATVATGAKSGGFNGSFGAASIEEREFEQEETINYELGAKMELLNGKMRLNTALFRTVYDDFQAVSFDPQTVAFIVLNAGEQTTQGVDLDLSYRVTDGLTFTAKLEYLDAKYGDFKGANCSPLAEGVEFVTPGSSVCNLDGQTLPFAPKWSGSLMVDYIKAWKQSELYANLNNQFKTDHLTDPTQAPYSEEQYSVFNTRIGWRNDSWDISAWGKNITDETYAQGYSGNVISGLVGLPTEYRVWLNDPRTYGLTVRYNFY